MSLFVRLLGTQGCDDAMIYILIWTCYHLLKTFTPNLFSVCILQMYKPSIVMCTFLELRLPTSLLLFQGTLLHHLREGLEVLDQQQRGDQCGRRRHHRRARLRSVMHSCALAHRR